jgi:hypothetical protein
MGLFCLEPVYTVEWACVHSLEGQWLEVTFFFFFFFSKSLWGLCALTVVLLGARVWHRIKEGVFT